MRKVNPLKMSLLESYQIDEKGYHPFIIREGWQVAQLNYMDDQNIKNINKVDIHYLTDEVFVLLKGLAVLIAAEFEDGSPVFETRLLRPGITYNVPKNCWHNIAMEKGAEVLIVEKSNTHKSDFDYFYLNTEQQVDLKQKVLTEFDRYEHSKSKGK